MKGGRLAGFEDKFGDAKGMARDGAISPLSRITRLERDLSFIRFAAAFSIVSAILINGSFNAQMSPIGSMS